MYANLFVDARFIIGIKIDSFFLFMENCAMAALYGVVLFIKHLYS